MSNEIVKVKSNENGKLFVETPDGFRNYYPAPKRTMFLYGDTLKVSMRSDPILRSSDKIELKREIEGTAFLKGQSISVMGDPTSTSTTFGIVFEEVTSDGREKQAGAEKTSSSVPEYTRAWVHWMRLEGQVSKGHEWIAQCMVSPETLDVIASAVTSKTLSAFTVGMKFDSIYIDSDDEEDWMDPRPVHTWYLRWDALGQKEYGAVTYLDLALGSVELGQHPKPSPEPDASTEPKEAHADAQVDHHATALYRVSANIEKLRFVLVWIGGLIALALVAVAIILK